MIEGYICPKWDEPTMVVGSTTLEEPLIDLEDPAQERVSRRSREIVLTSPMNLSDEHLRILALRLRKWTHFLLSAFLLLVQSLIVQWTEGRMQYRGTGDTTTAEYVLGGFVCAAQVGMVVATLRFLLSNRNTIRLNDIWVHYLAQICNFAGVYFYTYMIQREQGWRQPRDPDSTTDTASNTVLTFVYYSTQTQTLVGYGDVVPRAMIPGAVAMFQMLLGILNISLFINNTVSQLSPVETPKRKKARVITWYVRCRHWLRQHILLVLMASLAFKIVVMHSLDSCILGSDANEDQHPVLLAAFVLLMSIIELGAICMVSLKFLRNDKAHTATLSFVVQAYLSVCVLFVGIFMVTLAFDKNSWHLDWKENLSLMKSNSGTCHDDWRDEEKTEAFFSVVGEFCYISISTMTTAGQGASFPTNALARTVVCFQALASVYFSAVILAFGAEIMTSEKYLNAKLKNQPSEARYQPPGSSSGELEEFSQVPTESPDTPSNPHQPRSITTDP